MDDSDNLLVSGSESSDQAGKESEPSGDSGQDGAGDRDQGAGGTGETPAKTNPPPDNSISDDEEAALIKALSSGDMDSIGDDGKPKKPATDDKTPDKADIPAPKADSADADKAKAEETTATEEKAKEEDRPLSDEEQAELKGAPKRYHDKISKLFKERRSLLTEVEKTKASVQALTPVKQFTDALLKHATEAGLVNVSAEGKIDAAPLRDYIEQEKALKGKTPKEIAAYYRGIADDLDPDSVPVSLPQDLKDLVDVGSMKEDEALTLARKREASLKQPELEKRRQSEAAALKTQQAEQARVQAVKAAHEAGFAEIEGIAKGYETRFGAQWKPIAEIIQAKLLPLLAGTEPKMWAKLAETVIEAEVAKRKAPLRTPTATPAPTSQPSKVGSAVYSETEENKRLAAGLPL